MDANNITSFVAGITTNLDGLLGALDKQMSEATKNITPEQAKEFHKAWQDHGLNEKLQEIKRETFDIKNKFGFK